MPNATSDSRRGVGFWGSHLCERLLSEGWEVTGLDSLLTSHASNLDRILTQPGFRSDNTTYQLHPHRGLCRLGAAFCVAGRVARLLRPPIHTMKVGAIGTMH